MIEPLTRDLAARWDAFVDDHSAGWFWHTSAWLAYQVAYRPGNVDASFVVVDGERVRAVVPLVVTRGADGVPEASYSGDPTATALCAACDDALAVFVDRERGRRAAAFGARSIYVAESPFDRPQAEPVWTQPGSAATAAQRVVAVGVPSELWHGVRKSYRPLIHRAEMRYVIAVHAGDAAGTVAGFAAYQALHRSLATVPRPGETYRLQGDWLLDGRAFVAVASRGGEAVGAAYWIVYKRAAYYASGAYAELDVAHAVVWRSLLALRDRGVTRASLGWQGTARTDKDRGIEFFKRGFGGADVPVRVDRLPL